MYKDINQDLKKYRKAEKLKKWRDEVQPIPWYFDGLENLCDRIHPEKQSLKVTDIKNLSHDTKLFRFISAKPNKALAPFRAGQYIGLTVEINGVRTSRPFSIVSSPNQLAYYELGIKRKEGGFVSPYLLDNVKIGDIIEHPIAKKFLEDTGMTLEQALIWTEIELKKRKEGKRWEHKAVDS